jgi:branched-chain amino acid transport system ATP-binding protein
MDLLATKDLVKYFGDTHAIDHVDFRVGESEVLALIGSNGAGKTTLVNVISGLLPPDAGQIVFSGTDVTGQSVHERIRAGIARSYQVTSIFRRFSVRDNLALAVQARTGSSFRFWRPVSAEKPLFDEASALAAEIGLGEWQDVAASELSHGEQRALEVGLALATQPKLLLLDEPMAGMGPEESQSMIALIAKLRSRLTLLLVEHDMDAIFRLADRISVLVNGRVIATDIPERIKANAEVRKAYLGEEEDAPLPTAIAADLGLA